MMTPASPFSILFRVRGTLTARYWITSGEPRRADAKAGEKQGGSGFVVAVSTEFDENLGFMYVITNNHVVVRAKTPVVRMNKKDGEVEFFETKETDWKKHPDGDDIAVLPISIPVNHIKFAAISVDMFLTRELIDSEDIGIGDDAFMVGRFINHEGKQQNAPAVRFGSIAMMPKETIVSETGIEQESFLVEIRSLPGYSGSAVILYSTCTMNDMSVRRFGIDLPRLTREEQDNITRSENREKLHTLFTKMSPKGPYLLGIDWCHILKKNTVRGRDGEKLEDGSFVRENTGMAGVIPAWKIAEVLNSDELESMRKQSVKELKETKNQVSLDDAGQDHPYGSQKFTRQDFESALKKVSRKLPAKKN